MRGMKHQDVLLLEKKATCVVTASHHSIINYFHMSACPIVFYSFLAVYIARNRYICHENIKDIQGKKNSRVCPSCKSLSYSERPNMIYLTSAPQMALSSGCV